MKYSEFRTIRSDAVLFDAYEQTLYTKQQILNNLIELWNVDYDGRLYPDHYRAYINTYLTHIERPLEKNLYNTIPR